MLQTTLFQRLALIFLIILVITSIGVTLISFDTAQNYHEEANQKLNAKIAAFTADHVNTFLPDGSINAEGIGDVMHSMMVINPDVEVYLLDTTGKILTHVAPEKIVVRDEVAIEDVKSFIASRGQTYITGDDPRNLDLKKIFSAAPVMVDGELKAYYYIILASQERESVLNELKASFAFSAGSKLIVFTMGGALILGLLAFWYQVNKLSPLTQAMDAFKNGDYSIRVNTQSPLYKELALAYNDMASKVAESIEKIKTVDQFRKELVANISHDLRTPLAIINGYIETLQIKGDDLSREERHRIKDHILDSSKRLSLLVNQLFELSNLENNQIEIKKEPFALDELIQDMLARYEVLASKKDILLGFNQKENIPLAYGDIGLVERVIQNLLDNALKFTEPGGTIKISLTETPDKKIGFQISDTGVGISPNDLSTVFERYKTSEKNPKSGTGLGLAIANKIMELHNTRISVFSKLDQGTTFSFVLPVYS